MSYSQTNTTVNVSHFAGLVIGPNGTNIKSLKEKYKLSKCFVKDNNLIISGKGCVAAKKEVIALIEQKKSENRQYMDRNLMLAEVNRQRKKQMKIDKKTQAENRLEAMIQSQIETFTQPTYTYNGKFNFDSEDEQEDEPDVQSESGKNCETKKVTTKELNRHGKVRWADICDEEESDNEE